MECNEKWFKKVNWKKVLMTSAILAVGTVAAVLSTRSGDNDELGMWLESASDEELSNTYQEKRREHIQNRFPNNEPRSLEMERISSELSRRSAEKWENNPHRNTDPNYRWTDAARWDRD